MRITIKTNTKTESKSEISTAHDKKEMLTDNIDLSEFKAFIASEPKEISGVISERENLFQSYMAGLKAELTRIQPDKSKNLKTSRINYYLGELFAKCPNTYALCKKITTPEKHILRMQIAMVYYINALSSVEKEDPIIPQLILSLTHLCNQSIPASQFLPTMDLSIRERLKKRLEMIVEICQTSPEIVELLQKKELVQIFDVAGVNIDKFQKKSTKIEYAKDIVAELIRQTRRTTIGRKEYQNLVISAAVASQLEHIDKETGRTALHWAVINENESAVECLIESGSRFDIEDKDGKTAICYAAELKNEMIKKHFCQGALSKIDREWPFPSNPYQMLQPDKINEAHRYLQQNSTSNFKIDLQNLSPEFAEVNKINWQMKNLRTFITFGLTSSERSLSAEQQQAIRESVCFADHLIDLDIAKQVKINNPSYFSSLFYFKEVHKIHQLFIHKPILDGRIPTVSIVVNDANESFDGQLTIPFKHNAPCVSDSFDSYFLLLNPVVRKEKKPFCFENSKTTISSKFDIKFGYPELVEKPKKVVSQKKSQKQYVYFNNNQDFLKILKTTNPELVELISNLKNLIRQEALITDRYTGAFFNYLKETARKLFQRDPDLLYNLYKQSSTMDVSSINSLREMLSIPVTVTKPDPSASISIKSDFPEKKEILEHITIEEILKKTNSKSLEQSLRRVAAHTSKAKVITDLPDFDADPDYYISVVKNKAITDPESVIGQLHLLIEAGANFNERDENESSQKTAIHRSIEKNDEAAVAYLLLVRNADYTIQDAQQKSALVYPGNDKIKKILFYKLATDVLFKAKSLIHPKSETSAIAIFNESNFLTEKKLFATTIFNLIATRFKLNIRMSTQEIQKYMRTWLGYFNFLFVMDLLRRMTRNTRPNSLSDFLCVIFKECKEIRKSQISLSFFQTTNEEYRNLLCPFFLIQPHASLEFDVLEKSTILITDNAKLLIGKAVSKYINQYPKKIIQENVLSNELPNFDHFPDCKQILQDVLSNAAKATRREIKAARYQNYLGILIYKSAFEALSHLKDPKLGFDWLTWVNTCWSAVSKEYSPIVSKITRILLNDKFDPSLLDDHTSISRSSSHTIFHEAKSQAVSAADKSGINVSTDEDNEDENDDENDKSPR